MSWSKKYYPGLTEPEHRTNDEWFKRCLELLSDGGVLMVPNLQKAFNKKGEHVGDF